MAAMSSGRPSFRVAAVFTISGTRVMLPRTSSCTARRFCTTLSAPSRSALLTTNTSAISRMPALMACTSSPRPGTSTTSEVSAQFTISISSCPTPTVSITTTSAPQASSTKIESYVARLRPPRLPRVASERMNTFGLPACSCMRMRSPRMAPPVKGLEGSTASTPTLAWVFSSSRISAFVSVLLPEPGLPVMPST